MTLPSGSKTSKKIIKNTGLKTLKKINETSQHKRMKYKIIVGINKLKEIETKEFWKPLPMPLFKNKYQISNKGRIRNIKKTCFVN